jgi:acetyl-CoA synthetase
MDIFGFLTSQRATDIIFGEACMNGGDFVWWPSPEVKDKANLTAFIQNCGVADYDSLVSWSEENPEEFHKKLFDFIDLRFFKYPDQILDESMGPAFAKWCNGGTTNVALNCLDKWKNTPTDSKIAIDWEGEDGTLKQFTYSEVRTQTNRLAAGLRNLGLGAGDVIAMYLPNVPEAAITLLAVAKIGGIVLPMFSGFGGDAILARLNDSGAKAIVTVDGSPRRGRAIGAKAVIDEVASQAPALRHVIVAKHWEAPHDWIEGRDHWWDDLTGDVPDEVETERVEADSPFLLIYTSGTTGKPKGVLHSHCGFPAKLALDLSICMDFKPDDRLMWMSDMGWLVGPILVYGGLQLGGTVVLIEGAPNYPEADRYWRLIADHKVSWLGIAPTIVRTLMANGPEQLTRHDLSSLRIFASTGEAWDEPSWLWLFNAVGKGKLPILNYSGGTEVGGIVATTVVHPLKPCAFSGPVPGVGADVVDEFGKSVDPGEVGELVMRRPSIGLTRGLWNDRDRYLETYWNVIPEIWVHGDFASKASDGTWMVHGRSDDTLKIAGKRTGPAEIEALLMGTQKLVEAAAIGIPHAVKGTAIVCACQARTNVSADDALKEELAEVVAKGLGKPFRPSEIIFVSDLPKTRNMKIMRRVVRAAYLGTETGDLSSLINPESVEELRRLRRS